MSKITLLPGRDDLLRRQTLEIDLPRFLIRIFEREVAKANESADDGEELTLNNYIEYHLAEFVSLADVVDLEREVPVSVLRCGAGSSRVILEEKARATRRCVPAAAMTVMSKDEWSLLISVIAIGLSGTSLGWNIYRDVVLKPRVKVKAGVRGLFGLGEVGSRPLMKLLVTAVNFGPGDVFCQAVVAKNAPLFLLCHFSIRSSGKCCPRRLKRLRRRSIRSSGVRSRRGR